MHVACVFDCFMCVDCGGGFCGFDFGIVVRIVEMFTQEVYDGFCTDSNEWAIFIDISWKRFMQYVVVVWFCRFDVFVYVVWRRLFEIFVRIVSQWIISVFYFFIFC